ncbi:hypothetical protein ACHAXM_005954 [Skeletonema potamos]
MIRFLLLLLTSYTIRAFQSGGSSSSTCRQIILRHSPKINYWRLKDAQPSSSYTTTTTILSTDKINCNDLMVMDVVLFQRRRRQKNNITTTPSTILELGAIQENGSIAPLSTWTLESAYTSASNDMMEFVVDEEDLFPGLRVFDDSKEGDDDDDDDNNSISVLSVLTGEVVGYGSRQVGGGKGPGNPHGEESEMIYYVDRSVVEGRYVMEGRRDDNEVVLTIDVVVNPGLEHLW